jgi:orotidine-5'-phosphate decarboxylase
MLSRSDPSKLLPQERLIVALDVPTREDALRIVDDLGELVSFYKVGLELLMSGGMDAVLHALAPDKSIFVDLKLPSDIPETVRRVVSLAAKMGVKFLTLSHSASRDTLQAAVRGRGEQALPELLFVPVLSSVDASDFARDSGSERAGFQADLLRRAVDAKKAGADGFVVSGEEIALLRRHFPDSALVSPGIRLAGAARDDHKRSCTPAEAIRRGADYIVVGRPIRDAKDRCAAAQRIVDDIASAAAAV